MNCYTNLYIKGPKAELKSLQALLKKWIATDVAHSSLGKNSIENILVGAGLPKRLYTCHAVIDYIDTIQCYSEDEGGCYFTVDYKSERKPMPQIWYAILKKFAPHCKAYWFAMDSENNLYMTNDKNHIVFGFDYIVRCKVHEENPFHSIFLFEDSYSPYELLLQLNKVCKPQPLADMIKEANAMPLQSDEVFGIHKIRVTA